MITTKQYYAFISYKRDDQKWAEWLQEKLEHYKLPSNLNGRDGLPKEIRPVFRDKSELAAGVLADEIQKALDHSKYLIVICSPHSAKSEWVNKEVQSFIDSGRTDKIIPFIIEGTPNSGNDETECFPKAIRELPAEDELLGVNINEMGRDAAAVKVVAQMFGLRFDDLWQRHEREKKRRRNMMIFAGVFAFFVMAGIALWMYMQRQQTLKANWKMLENQSKLVAKEVIANAKDDSYLARRIALEILPKDIANPTDRPYTAEAERALRRACNHNSAIFKIGLKPGNFDAKFSPDGSQIMVKTDSTLHFYDTKSGDIIKSFKIDYAFYDNCYSPDGTKILLRHDSALIILEAQTGAEIRRIIDVNSISSANYNRDGDKIVTTNDGDHLIKIWDSNTGEIIKQIYCKDYVGSAFLSPDDKTITCLTFAKRGWESPFLITVIDAGTGEVIKTVLSYEGVGFFRMSPDGNKLITNSNSEEEDYIVWDTKTWEKIATKKIKNELLSIGSAEFSPDGKTILTTPSVSRISNDNSIMIIDVETGEEKQILKGHVFMVSSACFSPDGLQVVSTAWDGTLRLWSVDDKPGLNVLTKADYPKNTSISSDGKRRICVDGNDLAAVDNENDTIWKIRTWSFSFSASFSHDEKMVVYASNYMAVLDSETGEEIVVFPREHTNPMVFDAKFNSDGKCIVTVSADGTARIWDVEKGICTKVLEGHTDAVLRACYSPDGKYIATVSADETIRVWDAESGACLHIVEGSQRYVNAMSFTPDGRHIVTATIDSIVCKYDFPPLQELIDLTCERFKNRPLTEEERKMYYLE